jgi:chromosome segregation ATPase
MNSNLDRKLGIKKAELDSALQSVPILTQEIDKAKRELGRKEEALALANRTTDQVRQRLDKAENAYEDLEKMHEQLN